MKTLGPRRSLYEPLAEINVTPLVDVMLVLLIVFMITAPMLAAGMKVALPQAQSVDTLEPKHPIVITVKKDGRLFLGRDEVARTDIVAAVQRSADDDRNRAVHLRGDRDAAYGGIVSVMDRLAAAGFSKIALIADTRSAGDDGH